MTWNNHGKWHIDHIIPCCAFDLADPEQRKRCFHYTNLQPLWAQQNFRKDWRNAKEAGLQSLTPQPMELYTYPARPAKVNMLPPGVEYDISPKYNGWRALVHVPTRKVLGRQSESNLLSYESPALIQLCAMMNGKSYKWIDVEVLSRRRGIAKGCLIVLDAIPEPDFAAVSWSLRRKWLERLLPVHDWVESPSDNTVLLAASIYQGNGPLPLSDYFRALQRLDAEWRCADSAVWLYEGIVAKAVTSPYPIQIVSPERQFVGWLQSSWAC
jgi:hypothetical protein